MLKIEKIIAEVLIKPFREIAREINPIKDVRELVLKNTFNIFFLFFSSISLSLLLTCGILLTLLQLSYQYDQGYRFFINGGILTGLLLIGVCIISILIIRLTTKNTTQKPNETHIDMQVDIHPLELALANLINDFISEQNLKRSTKLQQEVDQKTSTEEKLH